MNNVRLPAPRPLRGFLPVFAWGLTQVVRWKKVFIVAAVAALLAWLIGDRGIRGSERNLANAFDQAVLGIALPLIALLLATDAYAFEIQERTLVYHLVRPVSRRTIFLARFLSGLLPALAVGLLFVGLVVATSRVDVRPEVWRSLPITVGLGMLALASVFYVLTTLLKHGLVAGLVYTFVIEGMIANVPGSMQKLSVMFHVRSLHHRLTEGALVRSSVVRSNDMGLGAMAEVEWDTLTTAVVVLLGITVVALTVGVYVVSRRDYALKD